MNCKKCGYNLGKTPSMSCPNCGTSNGKKDELQVEQYDAAEAEARTEKGGLWRIDNPMTPWEWRKRKRG